MFEEIDMLLELISLRNLGLTEEDIQGYLEFFPDEFSASEHAKDKLKPKRSYSENQYIRFQSRFWQPFSGRDEQTVGRENYTN